MVGPLTWSTELEADAAAATWRGFAAGRGAGRVSTGREAESATVGPTCAGDEGACLVTGIGAELRAAEAPAAPRRPASAGAETCGEADGATCTEEEAGAAPSSAVAPCADPPSGAPPPIV